MRTKAYIHCLSVAAFWITGATAAMAQGYTLVSGDRITLNYNILEEPRSALIDLDGNIRLAEIGSVSASGKTFDEIEADIELAMTNGGFSGVPNATVEIEKHAPVIVAGLVDNVGEYEFVPGMTVGVALAMSGGLATGTPTGANTDLSLMNAQRRANTSASDIAETVATITRLKAALSNTPTPLTLEDSMRAILPIETQDSIVIRLEHQAKALDHQRESTRMLIASWAREIEENKTQLALIEQRISLKSDTIKRLETEVSDAQGLQSKGLGTTARTSTVVQRLSDEREDLLALETAKVNARRAQALAERNRDRFESDLRQNWLESLSIAEGRIESLLNTYRIAQNEIALLFGTIDGRDVSTSGIAPTFEIRGPRASRYDNQTVTSSSNLLPGDILIVSLQNLAK